MKLKLDGALGVVLMMVMEYLKIPIPEEEPEPSSGVIPPVPVVGEPPSQPPEDVVPEPGIDEGGDPAQAPRIPPPPPVVEQVIEHVYPTPVVLLDDTEKEELLRAAHVDSTTTTTIPTTTRTIHRRVE